MTLFSIALNNIKNNFKNYWTFFLSSTFSVFVLYLFISIINNNSIKSEFEGKKAFSLLFIIASYVVVIFSSYFIWYSNSFFIKSRKKEFALYMMLGMSKRQTFILSFVENFISIVCGFFTGIMIGLILNKFFLMLLYVMIGATGNVEFQFSLKAFSLCSIVFGVMFILISIHSLILIYKNNIIDLFNASRKVEKDLNVSFITGFIALLSMIFLGTGYYIAIRNLAENIRLGPLVVSLVIIGTILFFIGVISFIIYINKKNEKSLFKGIKLIATSQIYHRYKGNISTLSVISVATTIALCAMITCFGLFDKVEESTRYVRPFSIEYINDNDAIDKSFKETLKKHKEVSIKHKQNIELLEIKSKVPLHNGSNTFFVINESEFYKVISSEKNHGEVNLKNSTDCYFLQISNFVPDKSVIGKTVKLMGKNKEYNLKITGTDMKYFIAMEHFKETFVVKDSVYNEIKNTIPKEKIFRVTGYIFQNDFFIQEFIKDLRKQVPSENNLLTFYESYRYGLKLTGMMAFIGIFLGLVFLTAAGGIIYFKIIMEAREDKNKFIILRKIGVSQKEIKKAISKEVMILFGWPFMVAVINSYVASIVLGKMMALKMRKSFAIIISVYAVLYSIYYLITVKSYIKTISE
ncbi:ABC transporter permease [Clostridium sporogenes]|uniref:ABC transporter permease n=1 Tax=Clostridium sporogenes TaxID=1509 RepID=A0ABX4K9G2_CLOSG|nr:ABC transporter permease [Clostridium sporogenes]MBW5456101.1 FtsX-like permease family protein [Clostridium sporogenes]NFH45939.1 ABC transporter permease [Clostridium sporogenes]PHH00518.1 ABC transporter permease [Clostridium sporogenes]UBI11554.1 ABC transporter permease [Clostridium sporogenes]